MSISAFLDRSAHQSIHASAGARPLAARRPHCYHLLKRRLDLGLQQKEVARVGRSSPINATLKPDAAGFLYVDTAKFHDVFAADPPRAQTSIMAVMQKPLAGAVFDQSNPGAGWRNIPSWYIVAKKDQAINPDAERFYAKRANAKTTEVESSHVIFLSHPDVVVSVIVNAATAAAKR